MIDQFINRSNPPSVFSDTATTSARVGSAPYRGRKGAEGSLQLLKQVEHIGRVWVLLPHGPLQQHRVEAGMGRRELHGAVKSIQEKPGGIWVYLHQVEENPVERQKGVSGA